MPPKKCSKKSSKQTPARNDGPHHAPTAAGTAPSAILDALDHIEESEESAHSSHDEQANSGVEDDSEDGNSTDQGGQGQDPAEGEAKEEEESSDEDAHVAIPQKRAIKTVAPLKAKSLYPISTCFSWAEPLI